MTGSAEDLADILGDLWLYVDWRWLTKQLTTEQKELWSAAVERWSANLNSDDEPVHVDRWWLCPTCGIDIHRGPDDGPHERCMYADGDERPDTGLTPEHRDAMRSLDGEQVIVGDLRGIWPNKVPAWPPSHLTAEDLAAIEENFRRAAASGRMVVMTAPEEKHQPLQRAPWLDGTLGFLFGIPISAEEAAICKAALSSDASQIDRDAAYELVPKLRERMPKIDHERLAREMAWIESVMAKARHNPTAGWV